MTAAKTEAVSVKFHKTVITNLESRFSDDVSILCHVTDLTKQMFVSDNNYGFITKLL